MVEENQNVQQEVKNDSPQGQKPNVAVGAILNFFWPGIGTLYLGQKTKGITFSIISLVLLIFVIISCGIGLVVWMPYFIVMIVDAILIGKRVENGEQIGEWQFF